MKRMSYWPDIMLLIVIGVCVLAVVMGLNVMVDTGNGRSAQAEAVFQSAVAANLVGTEPVRTGE